MESLIVNICQTVDVDLSADRTMVGKNSWILPPPPLEQAPFGYRDIR